MDSLVRDILAGIFTIILGLIAFIGINKLSRMIRMIGEQLVNLYIELIAKHSNREYKHLNIVETTDDRISNGLIKGVGLLFIIAGCLYLLSILFREIT